MWPKKLIKVQQRDVYLVGERIRATYQLCQEISEDLKRTDIELQAGSLIHLKEVTKTLTGRLKEVIGKL